MKGPPKLDFDSYEELGEVLRQLSGRLHYINRVAAGESKLVWHFAQALAACGALAPSCKDPALQAEFGDGWTAGTLNEEEARARLLELLRERM